MPKVINLLAVFGTGEFVTDMIIPIGDGKCGIGFDKESGVYWVAVEIHQHQDVVTVDDRILNISCEIQETLQNFEIGFTFDLLPISNKDPFMQINSSALPADATSNSEYNYAMQLTFQSDSDRSKLENQFRVSDCIAQNFDDFPLIDENGCSVDNDHITDIVYEDGYAYANVSVFVEMLKLQCKITMCQKNEICRPQCIQSWYDSFITSFQKTFKWLTVISDEIPKPSSFSPTITTTFIHLSTTLGDNNKTFNGAWIKKCEYWYISAFFHDGKCPSYEAVLKQWLLILAFLELLISTFCFGVIAYFCCCKSSKSEMPPSRCPLIFMPSFCGNGDDDVDHRFRDRIDTNFSTHENPANICRPPPPIRRDAPLRESVKRRNQNSLKKKFMDDEDKYASVRRQNSTSRTNSIQLAKNFDNNENPYASGRIAPSYTEFLIGANSIPPASHPTRFPETGCLPPLDYCGVHHPASNDSLSRYGTFRRTPLSLNLVNENDYICQELPPPPKALVVETQEEQETAL